MEAAVLASRPQPAVMTPLLQRSAAIQWMRRFCRRRIALASIDRSSWQIVRLAASCPSRANGN